MGAVQVAPADARGYNHPVNKSFGNSDAQLEAYVHREFAPEDPFLADVRSRQRAAGLPDIQVAALDGLHLEVLTRASRAERAVEVGTLGGYSGIAILRGLGPKGFLHTFEIDPRHAEVARETFRRAGVERQTHIHVGPALERLRDIEAEGPFDLVFVDADKQSYGAYVAWAAEHLRLGGIVLLDNAFLFGRIVDEPEGEMAPAILGMRRAHELLTRSGRFRSTMLPTGEGLALGVRVQ
jgi:caffeoyl-CoA O-methyltransferase